MNHGANLKPTYSNLKRSTRGRKCARQTNKMHRLSREFLKFNPKFPQLLSVLNKLNNMKRRLLISLRQQSIMVRWTGASKRLPSKIIITLDRYLCFRARSSLVLKLKTTLQHLLLMLMLIKLEALANCYKERQRQRIRTTTNNTSRTPSISSIRTEQIEGSGS